MAVRGSFRALEALSTALRKLPSKMRDQAGKVLGQEAMRLLADGFRRERDPYDRPWQKLKRREGKILRDTGRLRNSFFARAFPLGFKITSSVGYAKYHQDGTRHVPRRMMLPSGQLGQVWTDALNRAAGKLMQRWVAGGG